METMTKVFCPVKKGCCRLAIGKKGQIVVAVKTNSGDYKSYDIKTGELTNRDNFVFDIAQDMFYVVPTDKLAPGDIIVKDDKPLCVIETVKDNRVKVINYNDSTENVLVVDRHVLFGHKYVYSKIVSIMSLMGGNSKNDFGSVMKWMMMSQMFGGDNSNGASIPFFSAFGGSNAGGNPMGGIMQFMMMKQMFGGDNANGDFGFLSGVFDGIGLDGLFSSDDADDESDKTNEEDGK